jgi:hypothetical protein
VMGLITCGDVCLLTVGGIEVPAWRHRELFVDGLVMQEMRNLKLSITAHGLVELLKAILMRTWSDCGRVTAYTDRTRKSGYVRICDNPGVFPLESTLPPSQKPHLGPLDLCLVRLH